jgi:hypothetical protein
MAVPDTGDQAVLLKIHEALASEIKWMKDSLFERHRALQVTRSIPWADTSLLLK